MHGRHHLAGGVEGVLAHDRAVSQQGRALEPGAEARPQKRQLHRIAATLLLRAFEGSVIAQYRDLEQQGELRVVAASCVSPVFASSSISPLGTLSRRTVIRFSVSVPVLSVRMTVVAPRVSTADSRSISAFCRAMRHMPRASASVATIGKPSGMAATASAIAASTIRKGSLPVKSPMPAITARQILSTPRRVAQPASPVSSPAESFRVPPSRPAATPGRARSKVLLPSPRRSRYHGSALFL